MSTVTLIGVRIEKSEFYNQKNYTVVASPAPDAFSFPSKFRVTSNQQIGNIGQVVDIEATMRGVVKPKTYLDRQSGQQKSYDECDVYFDVVNVRAHVPPELKPVQKAPAQAQG